MTNDVLEIEEIAHLNDRCRESVALHAKFTQSAGINALPPEDQQAIRERVQHFQHFDDATHAQGTFSYNGHDVVWKVFCLDRSLQESRQNLVRILGILLAKEMA